MVSSFNDQNTALRMRDLLRRLIRAEIDRLRPKSKFGSVVAFSFEGDVCMVQQLGDEDGDPIRVRMGKGLQPYIIGQVVRFDGAPGNYWLTDMITSYPRLNGFAVTANSVSYGGEGVDPGVLLPAPIATDDQTSYPMGTSMRTVAADDSWPAANGMVLTHRYDDPGNRVRQTFYDDDSSTVWNRGYASGAWLPWV